MASKNQDKIVASQKSVTLKSSGQINHPSLPPFPRFPLGHNIPGRVRVKVFQIKGSEERAQALQNWLTGQIEVQEASAITGSFVLLYDAAITSFNVTHCREKV